LFVEGTLIAIVFVSLTFDDEKTVDIDAGFLAID